MNEWILTTKAPEPVGTYPHARRVGNLLFLSGVGPRKAGTLRIPGVTINERGEVESYDMAQQCHSVFENVKIILEAAGAEWGNLVDVTVFLTNLKKDFDTFNRVYETYFGDIQPCRTTVEVSALPTQIGIELKCVAYFPSEKGR